jgi:ATP-dependent Clp protease ATP-binding subunit ClpB
VLFDEVEKAHPRVLTLLLQLLDEGRLTDSHGRTVDFTNTVVILTSNIGAEALLDLTEDDDEKRAVAHGIVMKRVRGHFPPELLNRLSAIVMFNSLGTKQLEKICHKTMRGLKRRLATQGVRVILEVSGARAILATSYDRNYGARPVERYMEQTIVTALSRMLISGELTAGMIVHIEAVDSDETSLDDCGVPLKKPTTLSYRLEKSKSFDGGISDQLMEDTEMNE